VAGWHNTSVTVSFDCQDAESGIATCTAPVTVNVDGANQSVTGEAADVAGNTASVTVAISLDQGGPRWRSPRPPPGRRCLPARSR
jgi:hypothetical protein